MFPSVPLRVAGVVGVVGVVLVAAPMSAPLAAQKQIPGWTYTMNMTTDSGGAARTSSIAMRTSVTDTKLRTEFVQVSGMSQPADIEGMYTVVSANDSTMMSVMPSQRMATVMQFPAAGIKIPKTKFASHTTTSTEDLGAGERLFGHATHHVRMTTTGSTEMTLPNGRTCSRPADGVTDIWIAPDIDITPAMKLALKQYGGLGADVDVTTSEKSKMPAGLPLRSVTRQASVDATGARHTITTTVEYRDVARTMFEPSYFEAPAGFQMMDMRKMMASIPQGTMDSVVSAQMEKSSAAMCPGTSSP